MERWHDWAYPKNAEDTPDADEVIASMKNRLNGGNT